jgi:hypothetical protein
MGAKAMAAAAEHEVERLHLRVAWLSGMVLLLEGYDIASCTAPASVPLMRF